MTEILTDEYRLTLRMTKEPDEKAVGRFLKETGDGDLTRLLIEKEMQFSAMESCTSGLCAGMLTDVEGASAVFKGSFVTYSNEAKIRAGVPAETIRTYGVYSPETAAAMAKAAKESFGSDIALGVTGSFSNVDKNNPDSVAGEIHIAVITQETELSALLTMRRLDMTRAEMKRLTASVALKLTALAVSQG